jgi:hypothetical protein
VLRYPHDSVALAVLIAVFRDDSCIISKLYRRLQSRAVRIGDLRDLGRSNLVEAGWIVAFAGKSMLTETEQIGHLLDTTTNRLCPLNSGQLPM